jgi:hypothetical protein
MSGLKRLHLACCGLLLPILFAAPTTAQTLARPGWAGSGLAGEPWWHNAVFYRIGVAAFQDSDGDGIGDLAGIAHRLDYLQSLGIDAIIIPPSDDENAFNRLLRDAASRHIRIIIELGEFQADIVSTARLWLTRGSAGISVEGSFHSPADEAGAHLQELRRLINSFPGERVLIARPLGEGPVRENNTAQLVGQIIGFPSWVFTPTFHSSLLEAPHAPLPAGSVSMLQSGDIIPDMLGDKTQRGLGMQKIVAAKLLTSPGAASFQFGQELGLGRPPGEVPRMVMQWTPSNITPPKSAPEPEEPAQPAAPPDPNVYTAFKPYVPARPAPKPLSPDARPDPNSLPGFTSGKLRADTSPNGATANVAVEDADPKSLLNFYRRLIQLHHDNSSLRSGTPYILNHDAENALIWLRRAPAGSRTAATVIITCNLNDKPLTLSLDRDLAQLHMHTGSLRPLAASWTAVPIAQYSNHIVLPPYSVFIGELYHH